MTRPETTKEQALKMIGDLMTSAYTTLISTRQCADDLLYALTGEHLTAADCKALDINPEER